MSGYQRMKEEEQRLGKEIRQLLEQAQQTDEAEDELYGPDNRGNELREALRGYEQRLENIRAAKGALEAEQRRGTVSKGGGSEGGTLSARRRAGLPYGGSTALGR